VAAAATAPAILATLANIDTAVEAKPFSYISSNDRSPLTNEIDEKPGLFVMATMENGGRSHRRRRRSRRRPKSRRLKRSVPDTSSRSSNEDLEDLNKDNLQMWRGRKLLLPAVPITVGNSCGGNCEAYVTR